MLSFFWITFKNVYSNRHKYIFRTSFFKKLYKSKKNVLFTNIKKKQSWVYLHFFIITPEKHKKNMIDGTLKKKNLKERNV